MKEEHKHLFRDQLLGYEILRLFNLATDPNLPLNDRYAAFSDLQAVAPSMSPTDHPADAVLTRNWAAFRERYDASRR